MSVVQSSSQKYEEDLEGWYKWIGKKVCVSGTKPGVLKYFGRTEFADGIWCGVELNEPVGKNNGSVKGVQYFACKDNHGIFVSLNKVEKVQEKIWDRTSDGQKKLKNRRFTLYSGSSQGKIGSILSDEEAHVSQNDKRRKTTFFKFPNDNVCRTSITPHLQKPQLNNSYVISTADNITEVSDDILNKTVILTEENALNLDDLHNVTTNKIYAESNSVLNTTFDINHLQATEEANNNKETILDGTFVLGDQNVESNEGQICNASDRANSNAAETDDSLCILSLSQMKDFTVCTEQFINDSNVKLQNLNLSDSHGNGKTILRSESKPASSSGFFQTDWKLCQESAVLEDSVFLQTETVNGNGAPYRGLKRGSKESFPCHLSDEVKDLCFEPTRDQSSTPSEESKQMLSKKMSFIKSFCLDDSLKSETKRYSSSTPSKPAAPLELLVRPSELTSKVDITVRPLEDSLGNINLSLIDDHIMSSTSLDAALLTEGEPLKREKSKFDDFHISDLVSYPLKADDGLSVVCSETSDLKKSSKAPMEADLARMSGILSHSTALFPECTKQPVSGNLNITQELSSNLKRSNVSESNGAPVNGNLNITQELSPNLKRSNVSESNAADSEIPLQSLLDAKFALEGSCAHKDEVFSASKMYSVATKPVIAKERVSSPAKKDPGSGEICESVSGFPSNSSYCIQEINSESSNLNLQHGVSEMEKSLEGDVHYQTFNCNSSYTIPPTRSYTCAINDVNEKEGNVANGKMSAVSKVSSEPERSAVIDQLHNVPRNERIPSAENFSNGKDHVLDGAQNLNTTVCLSGNINSHNLTFDVTETSETGNVDTNRSNTCINLTRQSVGPVSFRINDRNKIISNMVTSKSALTANSNKPCVPNNKEQIMSNKFAESTKQNNNVQSQKPPNRRYSAAPRISSQENKMQPKNQIVSKIDTNLKAARLSLPRQSLGPPANAKKQSDSHSSVFKVPDSKAIKNVLNYQRLRQDARKENGLDGSQKCPPGKRNVITPTSENKPSVLKENTQAVNIPVQNSENGLPTPPLSRRSSIQSVSSQSSSKIAMFNKNNSKSIETKDFSSKNDQKLDVSSHRQAVRIPSTSQKQNTSRNQKLNDSANSQKSTSNAKEKPNSMVKKMESPRVAGRLSEGANIKKGIPRRSFLPKLKPVQQC